ncbi:uncharacterized protein [Erythrolamprus reginae]|uniref:uncharacterized protein n=1 Tax=Erythrolamprus reginae TaxID=121349 RepID=UPI00396CC78E
MASFVLFIFTIFLLFPLARSANVTKCFECSNDGATYCSTMENNCANGEKCVSVHSVTNLMSVPPEINSYARSCEGPSNHLTGSFSFNFGGGRTLNFRSQVCSETEPECQSDFVADRMNRYENGKSCPKCYRTGHDNCRSNGDVFCLGDLQNCTEVNGEITNRFSGVTIPFAGKGCGTRSVCNLGKMSFRQGSYTFRFKDVQCSSPPSSL